LITFNAQVEWFSLALKGSGSTAYGDKGGWAIKLVDPADDRQNLVREYPKNVHHDNESEHREEQPPPAQEGNHQDGKDHDIDPPDSEGEAGWNAWLK
jgi:hypothetical protein